MCGFHVINNTNNTQCSNPPQPSSMLAIVGFHWAWDRFVDVSERGWGVALLNDCKYGHDVHDSVIRLTLLKSPMAPNKDADKGTHRLKYALFPHEGDAEVCCVVTNKKWKLSSLCVDPCHIHAHVFRDGKNRTLELFDMQRIGTIQL
jgi:alpha-mannosidase